MCYLIPGCCCFFVVALLCNIFKLATNVKQVQNKSEMFMKS